MTNKSIKMCIESLMGWLTWLKCLVCCKLQIGDNNENEHNEDDEECDQINIEDNNVRTQHTDNDLCNDNGTDNDQLNDIAQSGQSKRCIRTCLLNDYSSDDELLSWNTHLSSCKRKIYYDYYMFTYLVFF